MTTTQTTVRPDTSGPADTRIMRIVHNALRRDLIRARSALTTRPYPYDAQRVAIGRHAGWLMHFLHLHHESEDEHLYPMVRAAADPAFFDLLDQMEHDHEAIQAGMASVERAGAAYAASADARQQLVDAIDELSATLLPHLEREENEMMPIVSRTITKKQWDDWDQEWNVKPLPPRQLAFTGNWIMDSQSPEDVEVVAALVPPVPRWLIRNVLIRDYEKVAFACWRLAQHSRLRAVLGGTTELTTDASPEQVWSVLTDVTRVGEWSHECRKAEWLDGARRAAVGVRFRGSNKSGSMAWSRPCTILVCTAPYELVWRTDGGFYGDATEWHFRLEPVGTGTRIVQTYRVVGMPLWFDRFVWRFVPAHHDRVDALGQDLERLAALATS